MYRHRSKVFALNLKQPVCSLDEGVDTLRPHSEIIVRSTSPIVASDVATPDWSRLIGVSTGHSRSVAVEKRGMAARVPQRWYSSTASREVCPLSSSRCKQGVALRCVMFSCFQRVIGLVTGSADVPTDR